MIGELQLKTMKANFLRDTELIFNMRPYIKYYVGSFCLCSQRCEGKSPVWVIIFLFRKMRNSSSST